MSGNYAEAFKASDEKFLYFKEIIMLLKKYKFDW